MNAEEFNVYDIVCDTDYEENDVYSLKPNLYSLAIKIGKMFDPVIITIDMFSKIGFNVSIIDGLSTYLIRYEDLMFTPVFEPDTQDLIGFGVLSGVHYNTVNNQPVMDVVEFISPVKYVHQVQQLLRICGYIEFANSIKINAEK